MTVGGAVALVVLALGIASCTTAPDTSVCGELPDPGLCPSGTTPLQKVPGGDQCVTDAQGSCGDLSVALARCGIEHPTCVDKSGIADPNTLQTCDPQQSAWDHCIDPNGH